MTDLFQTINDILNSPLLRLAWYLLWFSVVVLWLSLVFWTLKDARRRIDDGLIVAVSVLTSLVFPFIGTLVYTILRPAEYLDDVRERELEMRAMEQELMSTQLCPSCREPIREDFVACPRCRRQLRSTCSSCGKPLEQSWRLCPYCGADAERRSGNRLSLDFDEPTEAIGSKG
ncbi:MAG: zinc ribbon domain-containing protein [Thermoleophilia bacterium]